LGYRNRLLRRGNCGSPIAFPPDQKLAALLCGVHFTMTPNGIAAEDKISVVKRLGRSPDRADAVAMPWYKRSVGGWQRQQWGYGDGPYDRPAPRVIRSHMNSIARRR
jgi:hypothetical protein